MKKAGMLVAIVAAMVLALCLTGCGPRLDSEKTIGGMTYSVPSDWEEVPFSSDSEQLFLAKDGNSIDAFATAADSETPEDSLESWKESATIVSGHRRTGTPRR